MISNPELVAAVSDAGGFGLLATAFMEKADILLSQIEAVKRLTDKPFGANLTPFNPLSKAFTEIIAAKGLPAVTVSAGSPESLLPGFKERGIKVLQVVASVANAVKAEALGVDAVVAEGTESGGFQGANGVATIVLVPSVVDAVRIPVVAAGGIGDARGFRAALALGAKGVQVGTRFIASEECTAHGSYKEVLLKTGETGTVLLKRGNKMARVVRLSNLGTMQDMQVENILSLTGDMKKSWLDGELEKAPPPAGQVTGLINSVEPIKKIILEMVS